MKNKKKPLIKHKAGYLVFVPLVIVFAFSACSDTNEASLGESLNRNIEIKKHQESKKASATKPNDKIIEVSTRDMTPEERKKVSERMTPEEMKALLKKKNVFKDGDNIIEVTTKEAPPAK